MLAKIWKKLFLIICIIAMVINISHKLVNRTSVKEQLIELATTESLSTSIKNFVKEKYGEMTDNDKKEFSDPVGEIVDVFKNDENSNGENVDNTVGDGVNTVEAQNPDDNNAGNAESSTDSEENGLTKFIQNIKNKDYKTDLDDNPYFNDDPTDDLIDTTPPTFN